MTWDKTNKHWLSAFIGNMIFAGASKDEVERATVYSMDVIKHRTPTSDIDDLIEKYPLTPAKK